MVIGQKSARKISKVILFAVSLLALLPLPGYAVYEVDKVRMFLSLTRPVDTLKITNPGTDKPINLQVQLFSWEKKGDEDVYLPSNDLILSPPMLRVPATKTQLLRVGWRSPTPLQTEKAYRIYIQDISSFTPLTETGIRVKVKLGIPVFVLPANPLYRLNWQVKGRSGNTVTLRATNVGNSHVQVISATVSTPDGRVVGSHVGGITIFPGQSKDMPLTLTDTSVKNVVMKVDTDSAPMQANITLP